MSASRKAAVMSGIVLLAGGVLAGGLAIQGDCRAAGPATQPAGEAPPTALRKVAAMVNGEPIWEQELAAGLPNDAFEDQIQRMKEAKLNRLVEQTLQAQFLKGRNVAVPDEEIDREVSRFTEMITSPGCPCCGGGIREPRTIPGNQRLQPGGISPNGPQRGGSEAVRRPRRQGGAVPGRRDAVQVPQTGRGRLRQGLGDLF